jgi:hypothetical protein
MMRKTTIFGCALLGAVVGCRGSESPATADAPATEAAAPAPVVQTDAVEVADEAPRNFAPSRPGMGRASTDIFGLPVPRGVTLEDRMPGVRHLRARATYDELIAFYDLNIPGGVTVEEFERGARLVPRDAEGRAIFIYREPSSTLYTLSYIDPSEEVATAPLGDATAAADNSAPPANTAASAQPATATGNGAQQPAAIGQPVAQSNAQPAASAASRAATTQADAIQRQLGDAVENDGSARMPPAPITTPVVRPESERPEAFRSYRPPLRFVRGVREERRNPNAQF